MTHPKPVPRWETIAIDSKLGGLDVDGLPRVMVVPASAFDNLAKENERLRMTLETIVECPMHSVMSCACQIQAIKVLDVTNDVIKETKIT